MTSTTYNAFSLTDDMSFFKGSAALLCIQVINLYIFTTNTGYCKLNCILTCNIQNGYNLNLIALEYFFSLITLQVRATYCVSFNRRNHLRNEIHFRIFNDNRLWQTHANQYRIVGQMVGWLYFTVEVIIEIRCPRPRLPRVLPYSRTSS